MKLTDDERSFIASALRVAAVQYSIDAATMRQSECAVGVRDRLVEQFNRQSAEANRLADYIENAED